MLPEPQKIHGPRPREYAYCDKGRSANYQHCFSIAKNARRYSERSGKSHNVCCQPKNRITSCRGRHDLKHGKATVRNKTIDTAINDPQSNKHRNAGKRISKDAAGLKGGNGFGWWSVWIVHDLSRHNESTGRQNTWRSEATHSFRLRCNVFLCGICGRARNLSVPDASVCQKTQDTKKH